MFETFITGIAEAPLSADTAAALIDPGTNMQAVLPAGAIITAVLIHAVSELTVSAPCAFVVGYSGDEDAYTPSPFNEANFGTTVLGKYTPSGLQYADPTERELTITPTEAVTDGSIIVTLTYTNTDEVPDES